MGIFALFAILGFSLGAIVCVLTQNSFFYGKVPNTQSVFELKELLNLWCCELFFFLPLFFLSNGIFSAYAAYTTVFARFFVCSYSSIGYICASSPPAVYFAHTLTSLLAALYLYAAAISLCNNTPKTHILTRHLQKSLFFGGILFFIILFRNAVFLMI